MEKEKQEEVPDAFQKTAFNFWWMFGSQLGTPVCMKETEWNRPLFIWTRLESRNSFSRFYLKNSFTLNGE